MMIIIMIHHVCSCDKCIFHRMNDDSDDDDDDDVIYQVETCFFCFFSTVCSILDHLTIANIFLNNCLPAGLT